MKQDSKHPYEKREYQVLPYDPRWVHRFTKYVSRIRSVFEGTVRIEHIGSTSVPGLAGKPCVDVLVIVHDLKIVEDRIDAMERAGFAYAGPFVMKDSLLFREMEGNTVLANIHCFPAGHTHIEGMIALREYLRTHPDEVRAYAKCKRLLYAQHAREYAKYRRKKDAYMEGLKRRVFAWGRTSRGNL